MDTNELYKRSLGMTYDVDRAKREVEAGVAGYDGDLDRDNGFSESHSDLVVSVAEGYRTPGFSDADLNDERLLRIAQEIQKIEWRGELSVEDGERLILLEAERVVRLEQRVIETLRDEPVCAELLQVVLVDNLMERLAAGEPVDNLMFEEARDLAEEIATQHELLDADQVVELFDSIQLAIAAQRDLEQTLDLEPTPEAYSFLLTPVLATA